MDLGGLGGIGSAFGSIIDAFGNMTKAHNQNSLGISQGNQARSLAATAANTTSPALQQEFQKALQTKQMLAAKGIPNIDAYNDQLDQHLANSIAAAKQAGGTGDSVLATLSSLGKSNDASHLSLDEQDAQAREGNMNNLVDTMWKVGVEKDNMDVIRRVQQAKLNAQSGALSNASTANQYLARNKQTDADTNLVSGMFGMGSSIAGLGGGDTSAKKVDSAIQPATQGSTDPSYYSNRVYGQNAVNGNGSDTTNIAGGQQIQTNPSDSQNMYWSSFGLGQ